MIITKMALPRRTFLRGAGTMVALPLLEAMVPAFTALAQTPATPARRLGFIYVPHGAPMENWTPAGEGRINELSAALNPLTPFREHVVVPTNLEIFNARGQGDGNGDHARAGACYLSCEHPKMTEGNDYKNATTVDQVAAKAIGQDTRLPSLELSLDFNYIVGNCSGNGYNCVYMDTLAWSSPTTPLPTEANPRVVFERLFGEGGSADVRAAEIRKNRSILDRVKEDMASFRLQIGPSDRTKLSEYLDTIREVERRIQKAAAQSDEALPAELTPPVGVPAAWEDHAKLMFDLQVLAFQADITRVVTFQLARERSARAYPNIGVADAHHALSHHGKDPEKLAKLTKINAYHVSLFAYFLEKMKATPDGDGTLLDHSIYMFGSGMTDGNLHDHRNLPLVVAGGRLGNQSGRHVKYKDLTPLANLHLTLLDKVGVRVDKFADSTERIGEMLEPATL